jgi:quercetin dioxygenase-like cupin family protein
MRSDRTLRAALACAILALSSAALAQTGAIKRTLLQRHDVGDNREMILAIAEIAPGGSIGRHSHFGIETGYLLEGSASMEVEGEPVRLLKAGDSYVIPAGKVHDARVVGDAPAKVLATYVVEKGRPLATPAPLLGSGY